MANYKRIVCEAAVVWALLALHAATAAPTPDCEHHYDQRQNGTENYRLNIDGVVIAVAPAESLLAAASDIDFSDLLDLDDFSELTQKPPSKPSADRPSQAPEPSTAASSADQSSSTPAAGDNKGPDLNLEQKEVSRKKQEKAQRLKMRLANVLTLLRKNSHH
ncbi:hypothetical protein EVAR_83620_1 [Eumeta japonica]|uniref:Uncharacterized protein n=1 Tax=Eumeta variegata TaxID=151549 RepID=A0A4C1UNS6_EUMVA|nr:hypothetical protein EVAR_83620_1 [Eumeta japonica]